MTLRNLNAKNALRGKFSEQINLLSCVGYAHCSQRTNHYSISGMCGDFTNKHSAAASSMHLDIENRQGFESEQLLGDLLN